MKKLNVLEASISSLIVYAIGIMFFTGSYYLPLMADQDLQANLILMIGMIPAGFIATRYYYRKANSTNPVILGVSMFLGAMVLDALITVPFFIIPLGGNHFTFFSDPGFWLIGLEYILVIVFSNRIIMGKAPA